jgi:hypothetical protein
MIWRELAFDVWNLHDLSRSGASVKIHDFVSIYHWLSLIFYQPKVGPHLKRRKLSWAFLVTVSERRH